MKDYASKDFILAVVDLEQSDKAVCTSALGEIAFVPAFQIYVGGERADYFIANHENTLKEKVNKVKERIERRELCTRRHLGCFSALQWPWRATRKKIQWSSK
uniref:Uncharacterized protein n=1 Tax=Pyrodinium bahamense TaxID=73915 RepID=A0A7S0B247_9DINO